MELRDVVIVCGEKKAKEKAAADAGTRVEKEGK